MGSKSSDPPQTDYSQAAQQQGQANKDAAIATGQISNPNIVSPFGSQTVSYSNDPTTGNPIPTLTQTLNPQSQQIFDTQQQVRQGLAKLALTGTGIAQNTLGTPFNYSGPGVQTSLAAPGALNYGPTMGAYGTARTGVDGPALQGSVGNAGPINSGPGANDYGLAQGGVAAPRLQGSIDTSGVAAMPVSAGTTGYDALMSRLQPQLDRQTAGLQTQLTNQGLRPGDEAWDNAMKDLGYQQSDQRTQAALQGVNLDLAANQQGFNQAQAQGDFANQAALSGFGAGLQNAQLGNSAIAQNFGQGISAQQAQNAAQAQQFAQNVGTGQFANQTALEQFNAALQNANLWNSGIGQNYGLAQSLAQGQNATQNQDFNQGLQAGQFGNTAQQQAWAQALQQRDLPLNEIGALMSGSQIQNPQFPPYTGANVQPAPIMQGAQLAGQQAQNIYNQGVAQNNNMTSGLFAIGSAALMAY